MMDETDEKAQNYIAITKRWYKTIKRSILFGTFQLQELQF